jgi:SNF2 family DNA or RNA helicase
MKLYAHQEQTASFWAKTPKIFDNSDPGTGKTIAALEGYRRTQKGRMLVIAPLSILEASWKNDADNFLEGFSSAIAIAPHKRRMKAFASEADIVILNHDAVKWLVNNVEVLKGFTHLVVDEYTAFKNRTSQRSTALNQIIRYFTHISLLSGTPNSNTVLDLWHPAKLVDRGRRLGTKFWQFREQVCTPTQRGPDIAHMRWDDRPEANDIVTSLLKDITIRHELEACIDMPERVKTKRLLQPPRWLMQQYEQLERESVLHTNEGSITTVHASARLKKLLQLLSGAVYDEYGNPLQVHAERYQLIIDLVLEREQCVIAFNWRHELDNIKRLAESNGITYSEIHGGIPVKDRAFAVEQFQAGRSRIMICHPQSASHGLTLTAGTTTIWASPTYNAEHFSQLNARIYRAGQKRRTETIMIAYADTAEIEVYDRLDTKMTRMEDLLELFSAFTPSPS